MLHVVNINTCIPPLSNVDSLFQMQTQVYKLLIHMLYIHIKTQYYTIRINKTHARIHCFKKHIFCILYLFFDFFHFVVFRHRAAWSRRLISVCGQRRFWPRHFRYSIGVRVYLRIKLAKLQIMIVTFATHITRIH